MRDRELEELAVVRKVLSSLLLRAEVRKAYDEASPTSGLSLGSLVRTSEKLCAVFIARYCQQANALVS